MMSDLARETITVDGTSVTLLTGGSGEPWSSSTAQAHSMASNLPGRGPRIIG